MSSKIIKIESGHSLIEVLIAATVGILVISALTFTTIFSLRNAQFAKKAAQATKLAQEGIEWVRTGRDRNSTITNLTGVSSWDGVNDTTCVASSARSDSIWCYQINAYCTPNCYFNIRTAGGLDVLGSGNVVPTSAESILPNFKRVVILSDDASFGAQKTITVLVQWVDFAGTHESKLSTILRRL